MAAANFPPNPYTIGSPIDDDRKFFGRKSLLEFIEYNLTQGVQVILLHGQRRIGKSSVLFQIPKLVFKDDEENRKKFVFVFLDLQNKSHCSLGEILHILATKIVNDLCLNQDNINLPTQEELENNKELFARQFLPQVDREIGYKNLVLLLDEFDVLSDDDKIQEKGGGFFSYLQSLVHRQQQLFLIPVVGRYLNEIPNLLNLFKGAPSQKIDLLTKEDAKQLITQPTEDVLKYNKDAIKAILELSAGHPYFTQVICFNLYGQARSNNQDQITREDVENPNFVAKAIESAEGGLAWFWLGLSIPEKVVFSAVAAAQKIAIERDLPFPEDPFTVLRKHGVIETEILIQAADKLAEQGFLERGQRDYTQSQVKVELVRKWLVETYPLQREIWELETLEQDKVKILRDAATLHQQGNKQKALGLYEDVLLINPNHFSTVLDLAEGYSRLAYVDKPSVDKACIDKALEFYTRAYQFDPLRNTKTLVRELEKYGHNLFMQKDFTLAKQQYNRVLEIQPKRVQAQQRLKEIAVSESLATWICEGYKDAPHSPETIKIDENCMLCNRSHNSSEYSSNYTSNPIITKPQFQLIQFSRRMTLTGAIIALLGFSGVGIYRWTTPCLLGQQKQFGMVCIADMSKISLGERTLFATISNPKRDQGIEAYKQGNYPEAAKFFESAVADDRNDPEVLIYYNNALARSKGKTTPPITLAVVVPVDNALAKAQEMLRGVAQAQNQFNRLNNNSGLNGRLLEIAIANDGNLEKNKQPEISKQVALELVNNKSILGVIGHQSSDSTEAALPEYEKANLGIISPTSTSIFLNSKVFFRTVPSDAASGDKLAEYAIKSGLKKVVIFSNNSSTYSRSLREKFERNFEKKGGEIIANQRPIELNDNPQLDGRNAFPTSIYQHQAQAAVLFPDTNHISQALKIASYNAPIIQKKQVKLLGGDALYSQDTLTQGKTAVEGLILAVPWFREASKSEKFAQAAEQQWGRQVSWRTATSFDATQAFIQAFKDVGINLSRETVLQSLTSINVSATNTSNSATTSGDVLTSGEDLQFTPDGERQSDPILVKIQNGKFTTIPSVP